MGRRIENSKFKVGAKVKIRVPPKGKSGKNGKLFDRPGRLVAPTPNGSWKVEYRCTLSFI